MRFVRLLTVIVALLCGVCAVAVTKPILVVLERNPWRMVIGSDSPTFALYDDGSVIYLDPKPAQETPYLRRKVTDARKAAKDILSFDIAKAKDRYEISSATDQVTTIVWTPSKEIVIYGNWRQPIGTGENSDPIWKEIRDQETKLWKSFPSELRQALLRVDEQRKIGGSVWLPEKIEVMLWPYEYAPGESIVWPKEWPGLSAPDTLKRGEGSYSVMLPSERLPELNQFLATRKEKGAVLIEGKKMAESHRFPFPGESAWMR